MENPCVQISPIAITGTVTVEHLQNNGTPARRATHQNAEAALYRNEFRDILLRARLGPRSVVYSLQNAVVHKKFLREGKISVALKDEKVHLYFSNCPPSKLCTFVKFLDAKKATQGPIATVRERLKSSKQRVIEEISPLMLRDANATQSQGVKRPLSKDNQTTPTGKKSRPMAPGDVKPGRSLNPVQLTLEQKTVLSAVLAGRSVFFTGGAGTGKSYLLRHILSSLPPQDAFATATTGIAAAQIGGTTLHSFAGVGTGTATVEAMMQRAMRPPWVNQWRRCKVLVVDEVSMLDGRFFHKLERVARLVRRSDRPFGGIQLVLCGDFLQLPPVSRKEEPAPVYCFQTSAWRQCVHVTLELKQVHRQSDPRFISLLQQVRVGSCPDWVEEVLKKTASRCLETGDIVATRLSTHTDDVDFMNQRCFDQLPSSPRIFKAIDSEGSSADLLEACAPSTLSLKVGTQVMLTKNTQVRAGLANGSRGVIVGFDSASGDPIVQFVNSCKQTITKERWAIRTGPEGRCHVRRQLPLRHAWAMSIHKSQGLTLDFAELTLGRVFEAGQAYVALSRVATLEGLRVLDFRKDCVRADPRVLSFYRDLGAC
ncbi:ATP-dependent DNA helicase PIF1-like [Dermacentor silvarum]|uniref:ATP-dependent DNA helicase PIF1-like n=1 Tax=Dermacentor silvarum TaxID=543639 RepID=UPI00189715BF|nr:ATP-dependent DNA helicase PIF1-like [Dermacentor silvarum]